MMAKIYCKMAEDVIDWYHDVASVSTTPQRGKHVGQNADSRPADMRQWRDPYPQSQPERRIRRAESKKHKTGKANRRNGSATKLEIKTAYRRLMMQEHPDTGGSTERAVDINEAYRVALLAKEQTI